MLLSFRIIIIVTIIMLFNGFFLLIADTFNNWILELGLIELIELCAGSRGRAGGASIVN